MTILWGVLQITLSPIAARIFAKQAGETVADHAPKGEADI
jgi:transcription elongation GreA/GreB family factor